MCKIKGIFFDIDDTLFSTFRFARQARLNSVRAMIKTGLDMDEQECYQKLCEVIEELGSNYSTHYNKLLRWVEKDNCIRGNRALIIAAGVVAYHRTKSTELVPFEDVPETLSILERSGMILGVVTAGLEIKQAEKLIRLNLLEYFHQDGIFITSQVGIGKSNPRIYQNACDQFSLKPADCMYVGDNPDFDIDPPNKIGMKTVLIRKGGKHRDKVGKTSPNHVIHHIHELIEILREEYDFKE
ncbi:MAG: TIGR02253 family HAD-type hydrolase [bacterium]